MKSWQEETREGKRWRLVRIHLEFARDAIPTTTGRPLGRGGPREVELLATLRDQLAADALADALETLWALGDLENCRGGFWRDLQKAAGYMGLDERVVALRARLHQALAAIPAVRQATDADRCRVCGLDQEAPQWGADGKSPTYAICDCCGVEFGYEDSTRESASAYRAKWLASGGSWNHAASQPANWDRDAQLALIPSAYRSE